MPVMLHTDPTQAGTPNGDLQSMVYAAHKSGKETVIEIDNGDYFVDGNPLMLMGTCRRPIAVRLRATGSAPSRVSGQDRQPRIIQRRPGLPAVILNLGYGAGLEGIHTVGGNGVSAGINNQNPRFVNDGSWCRDSKNWGDDSASKWTPHAGIVVDPFWDAREFPDRPRYPGLDAYYTTDYAPSGGSCDCVFKMVQAWNFDVGFLDSLAGRGNGAECLIEDFKAVGCRHGWASAMTQNRNNNLVRPVWLQCHTGIDTLSYGLGRGCPPTVQSPAMSCCYQYANIDADKGPFVTYGGGHIEATVTIGNLGIGNGTGVCPASFDGTDFNLMDSIGYAPNQGPSVPALSNTMPTSFNNAHFLCDFREEVYFNNSNLLFMRNTTFTTKTPRFNFSWLTFRRPDLLRCDGLISTANRINLKRDIIGHTFAMFQNGGAPNIDTAIILS